MKNLIYCVCVALLFGACSYSGQKEGGHVKVWEQAEPHGLNPYTTFDATAHATFPYIYQKLLAQSFSGPEVVPVLAAARPEITMLDDSMILSWQIRPEAAWDNGTPVTARDVEFSFKALMCPGVNSKPYHSYIDFIREFKLHATDPLRFDMLCNEIQVRGEYSAGAEVYILPEYVYDPDGLLANYSYAQILSDTSLANDDRIAQFAERFNSESTARDSNRISGSGAYALADWETGQRVVFTKKDDWWGSKINEPENMYFDANPDRITHEVIPDFAGAITSLKAQRLDVMRYIAATDFYDLENDPVEHLSLSRAPFLVFSVMPINMRNPKLSDRRTRQALCCLMNYDRAINDIMLGYAERVAGPVHPSKGALYNDTITPYPYDPELAQELLRSAGWTDSDADGILDSVIAGKRVDFQIEVLVNNAPKEQVALVLQQDCKKIGIDLSIKMVDGQTISDRLQSHDFEMAYTAWVFEQAPSNFLQVFGTAGWDGGTNFGYFGDAATDSLIQAINVTMDDAERAVLVRRLQEIIHQEAPYIILWTQVNRIAINRRYANTNVSVTSPGYWVPGFIDEGETETAAN